MSWHDMTRGNFLVPSNISRKVHVSPECDNELICAGAAWYLKHVHHLRTWAYQDCGWLYKTLFFGISRKPFYYVYLIWISDHLEVAGHKSAWKCGDDDIVLRGGITQVRDSCGAALSKKLIIKPRTKFGLLWLSWSCRFLVFTVPESCSSTVGEHCY